MDIKRKELLYDGMYYDVTNWIKKHPGGKIIELYTESGEDSIHAIQQFHHRNTTKVMAIMKTLPARNASDDENNKTDSEKTKRHKALTEDFLKLFKELQLEGLFKPSWLHIAQRISELFLLCYLGCYFLTQYPNSVAARVLAILAFALDAGRAGWVLHDSCHHSLTGRSHLDVLIGKLIYGLFNGLSCSYWNYMHYRHHAMPQNLKYDVDLKTLPLIAFNKKVVTNPNDGHSFFIRNQKYLFLGFDTISVVLFWKLYLHPKYCLHKRKYFDLFCMGLHYLLIIPNIGIMNYIISAWLASMYLFGNFSLSHTHLPVTEEPTHWVEYSLTHTTNIRSSWWVDYWMGYLNYQIEHHLFPTMPQFKNKLCRDRVKALAKKHNLPYNLLSYKEAVTKTWKNLDTVSKELVASE